MIQNMFWRMNIAHVCCVATMLEYNNVDEMNREHEYTSYYYKIH